MINEPAFSLWQGLVENGGLGAIEIIRRLRRINAETQRFAEGRREGRKNRAFSSAFLRALCAAIVGVARRPRGNPTEDLLTEESGTER